MEKDPIIIFLIPLFCIGRINIVKVAIISKTTYTFNVIHIEHSWLFHRGGTNNLKIYYGTIKDPELSRQSWGKRTMWRHNPSRLQTILQSYSNQYSMILAQEETYTPVEKNRNPRNRPCTYGQLIFDKGGKYM